MRNIVLPAGTEFVTAEEVPVLLARALYPPADDEALTTTMLRVSAEDEHREALKLAAMHGELPLSNHARLPTTWRPRARVTVAAFRDYAARFEVSVTVACDAAGARASGSALKAAPIDWAAYQLRYGFTLFELACLLHRLDPQAVFDDAHRAVRQRGGTGAEVLNSAAAAAEMFYASPEMYFAPPVGKALQRLKTAAGSGLGVAVDTARARALAEMLGLPFPPELERNAPGVAPKSSDSRPETTKERRARLLALLEAEEAAGRKRGAIARITVMEQRTRPTADRSNIGKDIAKARKERDDEQRGRTLFRGLGK